MPLVFPFSHSPIECHFNASARDFVVEEIPLYAPSGDGEHLMIYVRKKGLSTFDMLTLLSKTVGIKISDIGYAGLKDKKASTYQYISLHKSYFRKLESALPHLEKAQVKILDIKPHKNKLRIGHLKGNRFFVRLKKVSPLNANKISCVLLELKKSGFPNYFGFQRFGKDGLNHIKGEHIAKHHVPYKHHKIQQFLVSSYQSHLFNEWLCARVLLSLILHSFSAKDIYNALKNSDSKALNAFANVLDSHLIKQLKAQKQPFILLPSDIMCHYPFGAFFSITQTNEEDMDTLLDKSCSRFVNQAIAPTGALYGKNVILSQGLAGIIENAYNEMINDKGSRRYAWVWAMDIKGEYIAKEAHFELCFYLPKGSYATIFLQTLLGRDLLESTM